MIEVGQDTPDFTLPGIAKGESATTHCRSPAGAR